MRCSPACCSCSPRAGAGPGWISREARTVNPPTNLQCTAGLLDPPTFTWDLPVGGLTRSGFTWHLSGPFFGGGTLGPNATTVTHAIGPNTPTCRNLRRP
ncbi:hypothetical protein Vqi01_24720 [Micromonospora qiuiae]|uniref:Ig-like domain-containing protein n=1 Tax=Micromonospora qiuiae TaxID=502268 RepID=A0ABQ4JAV0_9ACTN|nr:hypothetical protein Vqi01_24720 [Micromonospora qiuiae]